MQEPKKIYYQERAMWDRSQVYLVEYAVRALGPLAPVRAVDDYLRRRFDTHLSNPNLSNKLAELVSRGRIERIARGMYQHTDNAEKPALPSLFGDTPAQPLPSILD